MMIIIIVISPVIVVLQCCSATLNLFCPCVRFCEVEFHGPLSVQEDWIRHLQEHILKMNYSKPAPSKLGLPEEKPTALQAEASTSFAAFTKTALSVSPGHTKASTNHSPLWGYLFAAADITRSFGSTFVPASHVTSPGTAWNWARRVTFTYLI